jgi:hypothetical protein
MLHTWINFVICDFNTTKLQQMETAHRPPGSAVKGTATGLIMMAFFTTLWAGIAYGGLAATPYWPVLLIFVACSAVFIFNAVQLYRMAKFFPPATSPEDIAREKNTGKWFGIIFGAEGLGIFIAINIVINLGHPELEIPVIALVVGLHFFPLAKVFKRNIDYYFASYSTLIAILSIYLALNKTLNEPQIFAFTGVGIAFATVGYGIYMILSGRSLRAKYVTNP